MATAKPPRVGYRYARRHLRERRRELGHSQDSLASSAGIDRSAIAEAEAGKRRLSPVVQERIASALGEPIDALFVRERREDVRLEAATFYAGNPLETLRTVGERYGVSGPTVLKWLRAAGIQPRDPVEARRRADQRPEVRARRAAAKRGKPRPDQRARMQAAWLVGSAPARALVDAVHAHGFSGRARQRWKNRWNGLRGGRQRRYTDEQAGRALDMRRRGRSIRAIAQNLGMTKRQVERLVAQLRTVT